MLERRRRGKNYDLVPGEEERDLELGEGAGQQETGRIEGDAGEGAANVTEELDNWDENAEDEWEENEGDGGGCFGQVFLLVFCRIIDRASSFSPW